MDPWEVDLLIKYARKCKIHFVEIGTHKGGSASLISKYLPQNVKLTTIDTFEKPPKGSIPPEEEPPEFEEAKETIEKQGDISKVEIIKGHSWEVAETWNKEIDMVLIDGDHRYHAVKKDFNSWGPHVVKDGYILIHDIDFKGVRKAYREILRNSGFLLEERVGTLAVIKRKSRIQAVFFDLGDTLVNEEVLLEKGKVETLSYTHEALKALKSHYKLAIICDTDASQKKVMEILEEANIAEYFDLVVVSSEVGSSKPDEKIFRIALEKLDLRADEVVMIGNRISRDILGGNRVGMKTIHLKWNDRYREKVKNESERPSYTITSLRELVPLLAELDCT